jgi:hypothetical protein
MEDRSVLEAALGILPFPCALVTYEDESYQLCYLNRRLVDLFSDYNSVQSSLSPEFWQKCAEVNHPLREGCMAPDGDSYDAYFLPLLSQGEQPDGLLMYVEGSKGKKALEQGDDLWHNINNPMAIISMAITHYRKKGKLAQKDIDGLIRKVRVAGERIHTFLKDF